MKHNEIDAALDKCIYEEVKFLYLSPERLRSEIVKVRVKMMKVCLIAVDEAHCISQWGYDFRPSYLQISDLRELLPKIPVLALTATATPEVVKDIQARLGFKHENVWKASFGRDNLIYMVLREDDLKGRLLRIYQRMPGSSVIYVRNRKRTQEVATYLTHQNISATYYHAGLSADERDKRQDEWIAGRTQVMVATNAFGMGIDKADVRTVIHLGFPDSLEAYFQEAGRAGRDGKSSYAVALVQQLDILEMQKRLEHIFPSREFISGVYHALGNHFHLANGSGIDEWFELDIREFCERYNWNTNDVLKSISFLEKADHLILSTHNDPRSTLKFTINQNELYDLEVRNPRTARVTKVLIRSYSRLFEDHTPISEKTVAARAGYDLKATLTILHKLHAAKILEYRPSRGLPRVNFVNGKLPKGYLNITKEMYEHRKAFLLKSLNAAKYYMESRIICRSRLLLRYFGEDDAKPCGKCDVCLEARKATLSRSDYVDIRDTLLPFLAQEQHLDFLIQSLPKMHEDRIIKGIQLLMDEGDVRITNTGKLVATTTKRLK